MPGENSGVESYIVRIYRRGRTEKTELVGVVERAGNETPRAFKTRRELLDILSSSGPPASGGTARRRRARLRLTEPSPDDSR